MRLDISLLVAILAVTYYHFLLPVTVEYLFKTTSAGEQVHSDTENTQTTMSKILSRSVVQSVLSVEQAEGAGARVRRSIGGRQLRNFDPFLMLDEFKVKAPNGFPTHPHRGFETVTYMLKGATSHEDFAGHKGVIYPGDLQWMTAGRGIMHSEKPYGAGESAGLQLWVNLAKEYKMVRPAYQELRSKDISKVEKDGVHIAVIAGKAMDVESVVYTLTPTMYLDVTMQPGSSYSQAIPSDYNAFAYTLSGQAVFGPEGSTTPSDAHYTVVFSRQEGESGIHISVPADAKAPARFVLLGGRPINEPIVQHGPFVMNTQAEIRQTFEDFSNAKNGFEGADTWQATQDVSWD